MVLSVASKFTIRSGLQAGPNAAKILTISLVDTTIFLNLCKACAANTMASIPPAAFSAGRIRETQRDMKLTNVKKNCDTGKVFSTYFTELTPVKYNSKLMNSIWGFYNRYSPHNVKKINDVNVFTGELQQSTANSPMKNESVITIPAAKFENVWATL